MDAMAVAIHIKYALSLNRHLTFYWPHQSWRYHCSRCHFHQSPILGASRPQSGKQGSNVFVRAKDAKSPRLTRSGPMRCYPGHTGGTPLVLYASPAWSGFIKSEEKKQDSSLRVFARVEPQNDWRVTWIIGYHSVQSSSKKNPDHVIHPLLPPPKAPGYNLQLRKRSHDLLLPTTQSNILRKNFVYRMLFKDIY